MSRILAEHSKSTDGGGIKATLHFPFYVLMNFMAWNQTIRNIKVTLTWVAFSTTCDDLTSGRLPRFCHRGSPKGLLYVAELHITSVLLDF